MLTIVDEKGDIHDPNFMQNYYRTVLPMHEAAKRKYDPMGVFYCPSCVGSKAWTEMDGRLCRVS